MSCGSCVNLIERTLKKKAGVKSASVALSTGIARIEYDSFVIGPRDIISAIHVGQFAIKQTHVSFDIDTIDSRWVNLLPLCLKRRKDKVTDLVIQSKSKSELMFTSWLLALITIA